MDQGNLIRLGILIFVIAMAAMNGGQQSDAGASNPQELVVYQVQPDYPLGGDFVLTAEQEQLPSQRILWLQIVAVSPMDGSYSMHANARVGVQDGNPTVTETNCPQYAINMDCWRLEISRLVGKATICNLFLSTSGSLHTFTCSLP